jgi:hypothetical protein
VLRQIGPLDFAALGSQLFHYGKATTIAHRRDHTYSGINGHLERGLAERGGPAADDEQLPFFDFEIAEQTGPGGGVGFRNRSELGPGQVCFDKRNI